MRAQCALLHSQPDEECGQETVEIAVLNTQENNGFSHRRRRSLYALGIFAAKTARENRPTVGQKTRRPTISHRFVLTNAQSTGRTARKRSPICIRKCHRMEVGDAKSDLPAEWGR